MLISVIVPVYNEKDTLLKILNKLQILNQKYKLEIIVVNDGSTDESNKIIEKNSTLYFKAINLEKNLGKCKAVIEGLKNISGDYIFIQDADLEYEPQDMLKFIDKIENNGADMVMGSRFIAAERSVLHFWHMIGNKFISFIFNILHNTTFTDIYCCYCLFKRENIDVSKLKSFGWGQHAEILSYNVKKSKKIYEVAVSYSGRTYEEGKKIGYLNIFEVVYWIFLTKFKTLFD